ncbi:MAG TPA: hypothetical protein VGC91_08000 [Pyrinomonadaceae bacterium]|jgi:hypothetical protein
MSQEQHSKEDCPGNFVNHECPICGKKSLEHPDYNVPGTNVKNFSKWSKENIPKPPPKFKIGDRVIYSIATEIIEVYQDCDGSTLYSTIDHGNGYSENSFEPLFSKWTKELPHENGFYWLKNFRFIRDTRVTEKPAVVYVYSSLGSPFSIAFVGTDSMFDVIELAEGEWLGPLQPPIGNAEEG